MLRLDGAAKLLRDSLKNCEREGLIQRVILKKDVIKALLRNKPVGLLKHLRDKYPDVERHLRENIESIYEVDIGYLEGIIKGAGSH